MKQLKIISLSLLFSILLMTAPAAAVDATTSEHTTTNELTAGSDTNLQAAEIGDGALAMGVNGTTATRSPDNGDISETNKSGLEINPNTDLSGVRVTQSSRTSGVTTAYITDLNGNVLASSPVNNGEATIYYPMDAGTNYYVSMDAGGNSYTRGINTSETYPHTSGDVDITAGWIPGQSSAGESNTISDVQAITKPATANYTGAGHGDIDKAFAWANLSLDNADATITWQGHDGSSWVDIESTTVSTTGNYSRDLGTTDYQDYRVTVDVSTNSGGATFTLHDEGQSGPYSKPTVDNGSASPRDDEKVSSSPVTLSIPVNDTDFGDAEGDSVTVEFFVNGTSVGTDTLSSNGTATYDYSPDTGGQLQWHAEATDDYSHTQSSDTFLFETPSTLFIRNESDPDSLVTGANITVTFFSSNTVVERSDTDGDGKISLSGLPVDEEMIIQAEADGYHDRRMIIKSIYDQQTVYVLDTSVNSVSVTFTLDDKTGEFPEETSRLFIEKPINRSGTVEYKTVAADEFGAGGYTETLEQGVRYQLKVENLDGNTRVIGSFTPQTDSTQELVIGTVNFDVGGEDLAYSWGTDYDENDDLSGTNATVQFTFSDPVGNTSDLCLTIYNRSDENDTIHDQCHAGPYGNLTVTEELTKAQENATWVANWTADRNGESIGGKMVVGDNQVMLDWSIDSIWQKLLVGLLVVFIAGFFNESSARIGAVVVAGGAALLWGVGMLPVGLPVILAAGTVAILGRMAVAGGIDSS